jgi:hypothetical protein
VSKEITYYRWDLQSPMKNQRVIKIVKWCKSKIGIAKKLQGLVGKRGCLSRRRSGGRICNEESSLVRSVLVIGDKIN